MKKLNMVIKVCADCPYFDDMALDVFEPLWCLKSERELDDCLNPPAWCVLEDSDEE